MRGKDARYEKSNLNRQLDRDKQHTNQLVNKKIQKYQRST